MSPACLFTNWCIVRTIAVAATVSPSEKWPSPSALKARCARLSLAPY